MNLTKVGKWMAAGAVVLLFGVAPCAYAGTVTNNNDSGAGSLRGVIAAAASGETIAFAPSVTGSIALTGGELLVDKQLTITGPGANVLEINGNNADRVFDITSAAGSVHISGLTIDGGAAPGLPSGGGGIFCAAPTGLIVERCAVVSNAAFAGGGIYCAGPLSLIDSEVALNTAASGGGLYVSDTSKSTVTVFRSFIHGNTASDGGGIYSSQSLTINDSTISSNTVSESGTHSGGGLYVTFSATLNNSTVSGNQAQDSSVNEPSAKGGGIFSSDCFLILHNCTVTNNAVSSGSGGAPAAVQGGGVYSLNSGNQTVTVGGTIIAGNNATTGTLASQGPDFSGKATSQGFNLIGKRDSFSVGFNQPTDKGGTVTSPLDPKLGPLADNGGSSTDITTLTHVPLPGSPVIDKGKNFYPFAPTQDQRGKPRPYDNAAIQNAAGGDGSDIGAIEVQPPDISVNNPTPANEGAATAPGSVNFAITLSAPSAQMTVVNYKTTDGTAIAGSDYVAKSGRIAFSPGEISKLVSVIFIGDSAPEARETLYLDLSSPTNATIADARGVTSILNDDGPGLSIFDAPLVDEGNTGTTSQTFIVRLRSASTDTIKVNWSTANGTADTTDYVAASGLLTFAPGQTSKLITIQVKGDTTFEPDETYKVNLSSPTFAVLSDAQAIGTIRNDDSRGGSSLFENDEPSQ